MTSLLTANHQLPQQQQDAAALWASTSGTDTISRKGGILLNPSSPSRTSIPLPQPTSSNGSHDSLPSNASTASSNALKSPITPAVASKILPPPEPNARSIKFAPLPDPRTFHRSLSTGRNIKFEATLGPGGVRSTKLQDHGVERTDESALSDNDELDPSQLYDDDDDDDDDGERGGRRSSILGSSWSKSTKKILTLGLASSSSGSGSKTFRRTSSLESSKSEGAESSALSRSLVSLTRSLTPSSPGMNSSQREKNRRPSSSSVDLSNNQQKLLSSLSPASSSSRDRDPLPGGRGHRYSSSLDPSDAGSAALLSTSPRSPVGMKMLNGKVYGAKSRDAIRKAEEDALKGDAFREWGASGGLGTVGRKNEDEDDGSGMAWIKKRREAREQEERERQQQQNLTSSDPQQPHHFQPSSSLTFPDHPTVSQHPSSSLPPIAASNLPSNAPSPGPAVPEIISIPPTPFESTSAEMFPPHFSLRAPTPASMASSDATGADSKRSSIHDVQTYVVPGKSHPPSSHHHHHGRGAEGSEHATVGALGIGGGGASVGGSNRYQGDEDDSGSESEDEEDEDEADSDDDEDDAEEERLTQEARKTAQSAGVEVLSRHKSIEH